MGRVASWRAQLSINWPVVLTAACLLLSLAVRLRGLDVFLTADELKWTCRTINFRTALSRGDLAHTFQVGHPGVITMWGGSLGLPQNLSGDWSDLCQETRITELAVAIGRDKLADLGQLAFQARRSAAILTWLCTIAIVLLTVRLFGQLAGVMAAILVGLDPFYLALSRVLHLDALTGSLMMISFLALLVALERWNARTSNANASYRLALDGYLIVSGLAAGLAFLNKSPALILGPMAVAMIFWAAWSGRRRGGPVWWPLVAAAVWCAAAGIAAFVFWPALWVNPVGTVLAVLAKATGYAAEGHENLNFFLGQIVNDPGPAFYPVAWAFRTTPLVWVGLLGLAWSWLQAVRNPEHGNREAEISTVLAGPSPEPRRRGWTSQRIRPALWVVLFGLVFVAFMTVGAKKFDRYIVPTFLALDVAAAVGLAWVVESAAGHFKGRQSIVQALAAVLIAALQVVLILPFGPYLFSYFNPVLGGGARAQQVMLVGWGEGLDQAAAYLNARSDSRDLRVSTQFISDFGPLFAGYSDSLLHYNPARTDFFVFYVNQIQRRLREDVLNRYYGVEEPEHVVRMFGIDYAWVYSNADHKPVAAYLAEHADPAGDAVLVNGPSKFQQAYAGPLPVYLVDGEWDEARIVEGLQTAASGRRRLWYLIYPDGDNDPGRLIQHQLDTHAWQGTSQEFPTSRLVAYDLPDPAAFRLPAADRPADLYFGAIGGGPSLRLRGFGIDPAPTQFGRGSSIALDWQALQPPGDDLSAFIYLVDANGVLWGQGDKQIIGAGQPTSQWQAGETHLDRYALRVLPGTPPGQYQVRLGVYRADDNRRLVFTDTAGGTGTEWALGTIEVAPSPVVPSVEEMGIASPAAPISLRLPGDGGQGGVIQVIGSSVPPEAQTGESLPIDLFWEVGTAPGEDYSLRLSLVHAQPPHTELAAVTLPPAGEYPTSRWQPGERLRSQLSLPIPAEAPGGPAKLRIQFVDAGGQPVNSAVDVADVTLAAVERRFELPPDVQQRLNIRLGENVALAGYSLGPAPGCGGPGVTAPISCTVQVTLYWQALGRPARDTAVFVHVLDESGQIHGQVDRMPVDGSRPTSGWLDGEVIVDRYDIPLTAETSGGLHHVVVGMYDPSTLRRLPATGADGQRLPDDRIKLGELTVGSTP